MSNLMNQLHKSSSEFTSHQGCFTDTSDTTLSPWTSVTSFISCCKKYT